MWRLRRLRGMRCERMDCGRLDCGQLDWRRLYYNMRMVAVQTEGSVRIDVWLWAVRQVKTRSLATGECKAGHVRLNGEPVKPSQKVQVGDTVRYRFQGFDRILEVTGLLSKRASAPVARTCYIDHSPPLPTKLNAPAPIIRARGTGRPTKKERRALDRLKAQEVQAFQELWQSLEQD